MKKIAVTLFLNIYYTPININMYIIIRIIYLCLHYYTYTRGHNWAKVSRGVSNEVICCKYMQKKKKKKQVTWNIRNNIPCKKITTFTIVKLPTTIKIIKTTVL